MRICILSLLFFTQFIFAKNDNLSITYKEFKKLSSLSETSEKIVPELKALVPFKKGLTKMKINTPDGQLINSKATRITKFVKSNYAYVEYEIDDQFKVYNLTMWDASNKRFISWHVNQENMANYTDSSELKYSIGIIGKNNQYLFKSAPQFPPAEKTIYKVMKDAVVFKTITEFKKPDGSFAKMEVQGKELPN